MNWTQISLAGVCLLLNEYYQKMKNSIISSSTRLELEFRIGFFILPLDDLFFGFSLTFLGYTLYYYYISSLDLLLYHNHAVMNSHNSIGHTQWTWSQHVIIFFHLGWFWRDFEFHRTSLLSSLVSRRSRSLPF